MKGYHIKKVEGAEMAFTLHKKIFSIVIDSQKSKVIMQIWLTLASPHPSSVHSCFLLQITLTCCESGASPQVWMSLSSDLAEDKNEETAVVVNRFHSGGNTEE